MAAPQAISPAHSIQKTEVTLTIPALETMPVCSARCGHVPRGERRWESTLFGKEVTA